jgi:hypothetical protein
MKFDEAVSDLLKVKPPQKPLKEKKNAPKFGKRDTVRDRSAAMPGSRARKVTGSSRGKI